MIKERLKKFITELEPYLMLIYKLRGNVDGQVRVLNTKIAWIKSGKSVWVRGLVEAMDSLNNDDMVTSLQFHTGMIDPLAIEKFVTALLTENFSGQNFTVRVNHRSNGETKGIFQNVVITRKRQ